MSIQDAKRLCLSEVPLLLENPYLEAEAGYGLNRENLAHVAASTYMEGCSAAMIEWWFGYIHTTEQYKLWHPQDHVFSDWEGPRDNKSEYIGGHHLVHEYIGGILTKLKISFKSPALYFGSNWRQDFDKAGYGTAICGRVGDWNDQTGEVIYHGHLIHLVKNERNACRMRSHFFLGDIEGLEENQGDKVPPFFQAGLLQHATEEMAILASKLPHLYKTRRQRAKL